MLESKPSLWARLIFVVVSSEVSEHSILHLEEVFFDIRLLVGLHLHLPKFLSPEDLVVEETAIVAILLHIYAERSVCDCNGHRRCS